MTHPMVRKRWSRFLVVGGLLLLVPRFCPAQSFLTSGLASAFAQAPEDRPILSSTLFPDSPLGIRASYGFSPLVRTTHFGRVTSLLTERSGGLELQHGIRKWRIEAMADAETLDGRYLHNKSYGEGDASSHLSGVVVAYSFSERYVARLGLTSEQEQLNLSSSLLGTSVPVLGKDPDMQVNGDSRNIIAGLGARLSKSVTVEGSLIHGRLSGALSAANRLDATTILLPYDMPMDSFAVNARALRGKDEYELSARSLSASGTRAAVVPGSASGVGTMRLDSHEIGISARRQFMNGSSLRLHWDNAYDKMKGQLFDPDAAALGFDVPAGTTAYASGEMRARRTEIGCQYSVGHDPLAWKVGYRHVLLPFDVQGRYHANYFLVGYSGGGDVDYDRVMLGVFTVTRGCRIGGGELHLSLSQLLPYTMKKGDQASTVVHRTGPRDTTIGGAYLSLCYVLPFGKP